MCAESVSPVRVVIIYHNRLLRDLAVSLLRGTPVNLVGCVEAASFLPKVLDDLHPNVVILDDAASQILGSNGISRLFQGVRHGIIRVVMIGLEDTRMVVVQREVLECVDGEQFVASTLGTSFAGLSGAATSG